MLGDKPCFATIAVKNREDARSFYEGVLGLTDVVEDVVEGLKAKGVSFEHYDLPGATRDGDIHVAGGMKTAWFRDPDGNILNLVSGEILERAAPRCRRRGQDG